MDPLGRAITLHERTWRGHILRAHPEMTTVRELVEGAAPQPDEIGHSRSAPECRLYFGRGPRSTVIIMVVVDVAQGLVKTAHLAKQISGGPVEWSK